MERPRGRGDRLALASTVIGCWDRAPSSSGEYNRISDWEALPQPRLSAMSLAALRRSVVRSVPRVAHVPRATRVSLPTTRGYANGSSSSGGASWVQLALAGGLGVGAGVAALSLYGGDSSTLKKQAVTAAKGAERSAKVAANFVPTKEDYQKVYNRIAEHLDAESYDGMYQNLHVVLFELNAFQMAHTALYSCAWRGIRRERMTKTPILVEGSFPEPYTTAQLLMFIQL